MSEWIDMDDFYGISDKEKDACEIVHYAISKQTPVRVSLVHTLLPGMKVENELIDEREYEEWLRYVEKDEYYYQSEIYITDSGAPDKKYGHKPMSYNEWKRNKKEGNK